MSEGIHLKYTNTKSRLSRIYIQEYRVYQKDGNNLGLSRKYEVFEKKFQTKVLGFGKRRLLVNLTLT